MKTRRLHRIQWMLTGMTALAWATRLLLERPMTWVSLFLLVQVWFAWRSWKGYKQMR